MNREDELTKMLNYYAKKQLNKCNNIMSQTLIDHFAKHDLISNEELKKYYLDETGNYLPKLKINE
jgi:hypothetical protein